VRGFSHADEGRPCDDAAVALSREIEGEFATILVVADGVGSAQQSSEGSRFMVKALRDWFGKVERIDDVLSEGAVEACVRKVASDMARWGESKGWQPHEFVSTLRVAVIGKGVALLCAVGDGGTYIVRATGIHESPLDTSNSEDALVSNTTAVMPSSSAYARIALVTLSAGDILLLCTDGAQHVLRAAKPSLLDALVENPSMRLPHLIWELDVRFRAADDDRSIAVWWQSAAEL
jgi:serine/threonine protein phosphatase PrpC